MLAILPTLLSVALVLGLMGWMWIKLDMATALVASVALGLSVDDTFHCLLQFHRERKEHGVPQSLFDSYRVTGPGVILSSLAVAVGFMALRASEFEPFVNFGTMVAHRHRRQHPGQPRPPARVPDAGASLAEQGTGNARAGSGSRRGCRGVNFPMMISCRL